MEPHLNKLSDANSKYNEVSVQDVQAESPQIRELHMYTQTKTGDQAQVNKYRKLSHHYVCF